MVTNIGSTFPQTREMLGPTKQKARKTIQEEGELVAVFNLADEEGNLNFTRLTCNLKNNISFMSHIYMKIKNDFIGFSTILRFKIILSFIKFKINSTMSKVKLWAS